jgi:hypothetical protein
VIRRLIIRTRGPCDYNTIVQAELVIRGRIIEPGNETQKMSDGPAWLGNSLFAVADFEGSKTCCVLSKSTQA